MPCWRSPAAANDAKARTNRTSQRRMSSPPVNRIPCAARKSRLLGWPVPPSPQRTRYRFGEFVVSTARRQLLRSGTELPLIPRYFDLLVLLIERRHEAVHRRDILDGVWSDVVVSDGALSQAIRTLRRTLGDESRDAVFIRTVSRHGYHFVFAEVIEEPDLPD